MTMVDLIARQRELYPVDPEMLEWGVSIVPKYHRIKSLRGHYQAHVRCPSTRYTGWAIQKTEEEARAKALARLLYARDYALAGYREET